MDILGSLRPVLLEDLELILSWRNTLAVRNNMYTYHEISLEEHLNWWDKIKDRADQKYFIFEIDGEPLGVVSFNNIDYVNKNSSWAFYASPFAPKGTGSRMEFLALDYAFSKLKLYKLCCEVLHFNEPVIKLHQKFGFKIEGILRDQYVRDDIYHNIYLLGILSNEWDQVRLKMLERLLRFLEK